MLSRRNNTYNDDQSLSLNQSSSSGGTKRPYDESGSFDLDFRVSSSSSSSKYDIFEYNLSHKYFTRVYNGGYTEESFRFSELSRCDNLPLFNKDCFPGQAAQSFP